MVPPFINIYRTKEEAFYFENSPIDTRYIFKGVQLLPNNVNKYIQVTDTPYGINLEDWAVNVVDLGSGDKTDITDYFIVEELTNSLNGDPQFYWSLGNVPFDFGYRLVYLEIEQLTGEFFYTTPFLLTAIEEERVMQFHYKDSKNDIYQSIGIQTWFSEPTKTTELTTYYEVKTKTTVATAAETNFLKIYRTELMPKSVLINLTSVLESAMLYVNFVRGYLYEPIEIPAKASQENFAELTYKLSQGNSGNGMPDSFFGIPDYHARYYTPDYEI